MSMMVSVRWILFLPNGTKSLHSVFVHLALEMLNSILGQETFVRQLQWICCF